MSKKIVIPCVVGGQVEPTDFYVGKPAEGTDPIHFQAKWLSTAKKGAVPAHILKALLDLQEVAASAGISFEDLCDMTFNQKPKTESDSGSQSSSES